MRFRSTDARSSGGEDEGKAFPSPSSSSSSSPPSLSPPPPALSSNRLGGTSHLPGSSASASLTLRIPGRPSSTLTLTRAKSGPSSGWTPFRSLATPRSVVEGLRGPPARPRKAAAEEEEEEEEAFWSSPSLLASVCRSSPSSNDGSAALAWKQAGRDRAGPACVSASMGGTDSSKCSRRGDQQQRLRSQALRSMPA